MLVAHLNVDARAAANDLAHGAGHTHVCRANRPGLARPARAALKPWITTGPDVRGDDVERRRSIRAARIEAIPIEGARARNEREHDERETHRSEDSVQRDGAAAHADGHWRIGGRALGARSDEQKYDSRDERCSAHGERDVCDRLHRAT